MPDNAAISALEDEVDRHLPESWMSQRPSPALLAAAAAWSAAVWEAASATGPFPLDATAVNAGARIAAAPVFVCGTHRSGTTLLQGLLDGHPQLSVLPSEGSFLTELHKKIVALPDADQRAFMAQEWVRRFVNAGGHRWLLGRTTHEASPYVDFAALLTTWWSILAATPTGAATVAGAAETGRVSASMRPLVAVALAHASHSGAGRIDPRVERWVDKTPTNELHLDRLLSEFPAAKVVLMVRDPRDVFVSHRSLEERFLGRFVGERRALINLARSYEIAAGRRSELLCVRYEKLVEDPQATLSEIATYLGIQPDAALRQPTSAGRPSVANSSFEQRRAPAGGIVDAPPPRILSAAETRRLSAYAGESARRLGYALPSLTPLHRWAVKLGCSARAMVRRASRIGET